MGHEEQMAETKDDMAGEACARRLMFAKSPPDVSCLRCPAGDRI